MTRRDLLYVDDESDNLLVFEASFEDDFNILTARSGEEALEILERVAVPVVVADQRMPRMSGVELFEIMRRRFPYTKRVILTGYSEPEAMLAAINKGHVFHFVKKPWQRHELMSVLIRAFEAHDMALANIALTDRLIASEHQALLGQLTARVSHEINNQLCIFPLLESLEGKYAHDPELMDICDLAHKTYERLYGLLQEVKTFARIDPGDFPRRPVSLAAVTQELVSLLRFDRSIPPDRLLLRVVSEPTINANRVKLQQVLINLVKNAAHAIQGRPDGRIVLTVDRDGEEAVLTVTDNGCGMTEEVRSRIWEPFFTTKGANGTGLGLDISRELVTSHGGTISCESEPDIGTTFTVRLPTLAAPATIDENAKSLTLA